MAESVETSEGIGFRSANVGFASSDMKSTFIFCRGDLAGRPYRGCGLTKKDINLV